MAAPDPGHFVEHRLRGVRVLEDVAHREIRDDVGVHKGREGERHEAELQHRRLSHVHQRTAAYGRADQWYGALGKGHEEREDEREMADLYQHLTTPGSADNSHAR